MNIMSYDDMMVEAIRRTDEPSKIVALACNMTMQTEPSDKWRPPLLYLLKAEHTSVLEHCTVTFRISGVSRSLLAQLTRHRIGSFTSQSQHYQDYRDVPVVLSKTIIEDPKRLSAFRKALRKCYEEYEEALDAGVPREEARQLLPNAAAVNILWTVNARSLINFLRQRLCRRNVEEMVIFAQEVHHYVSVWWPELFTHVGPPCFMDHHCNQGKLRSPKCISRR